MPLSREKQTKSWVTIDRSEWMNEWMTGSDRKRKSQANIYHWAEPLSLQRRWPAIALHLIVELISSGTPSGRWKQRELDRTRHFSETQTHSVANHVADSRVWKITKQRNTWKCCTREWSSTLTEDGRPMTECINEWIGVKWCNLRTFESSKSTKFGQFCNFWCSLRRGRCSEAVFCVYRYCVNVNGDW